MTCERYWREGILLVEQGQRDPHRDTCGDCRRAHAARGELVRALPRVGASHISDPGWQMRVWSRIAREESLRARRSYWIGGGLAAACAAAVACLLIMRGDGGQGMASLGPSPASSGAPPTAATGDRPRIDIVSGQLAMRSTSARVGDRVRISVAGAGEVRVYRSERLVLRCPTRQSSPGCMPDPLGLVAEAELATAGDYQLVVIPALTADPIGTLDRDLAAVVNAGGDYQVTELQVR